MEGVCRGCPLLRSMQYVLLRGVHFREFSANGSFLLMDCVCLKEVPSFNKCLSMEENVQEVFGYGWYPHTCTRGLCLSASGRHLLIRGVCLWGQQGSSHKSCLLWERSSAYEGCLIGQVPLQEVFADGKGSLMGSVWLWEGSSYSRCLLIAGTCTHQ